MVVGKPAILLDVIQTPTFAPRDQSLSSHEAQARAINPGPESDARHVGVIDQAPQPRDIPLDHDTVIAGMSLLDVVKANRPSLFASERDAFSSEGSKEETKETSTEERQFPPSGRNSGEDQLQPSRFILPQDQLNRAVSSSLGLPVDDDEEAGEGPNERY